MKITEIKTFLVDCYRTNWVFVMVCTDAGINGFGEATLEYRELTVQRAIHELERYLIGKDPRDIALHYHNIYRDSYWRSGPVLMSALSAIDMCLWDINAKALDVPLYRMLGGKVRDRVKIYVNGWFAGARKPEEFARQAKVAVQRGVKALKWDPFGKAYMNISPAELDHALACIDAVRTAVGDSVDLLIEGHGRFNKVTAVKIAKELEQFKPVWFEEPIPPDSIGDLADVKRQSPVPIAAGERLYNTRAFRELLNCEAVDFVQPDVSHAGGVTGCREIAALADCYYIPFAPHNPSGPIANAVTLQLAASIPNFFILEIMDTDVSWRSEISDESLVFADGCIEIPDRPGIGISLNLDALSKYPYRAKDLRHYTGQLTDIRPPERVYYF